MDLLRINPLVALQQPIIVLCRYANVKQDSVIALQRPIFVKLTQLISKVVQQIAVAQGELFPPTSSLALSEQENVFGSENCRLGGMLWNQTS